VKDSAQVDEIIEISPDIYKFPTIGQGSHVYLIKGQGKNVLIDTGVAEKYPSLKKRLNKIGLSPRAIDLVILTHEHFDHIGATAHFKTAIVAAHRLAANKIELQDEFVTFYRDRRSAFYPHIWLDDNTIIDLGNYKLRVIHTPGHTSGCICLHELKEKLLFSGDTVFAGGTLSEIAASGNISDYMSSIERLNSLDIAGLYPSHGRASQNPKEDMAAALERAFTLLEDSKALFESVARRVKLADRAPKRKQS
jgi:glyoxylase-like metal-dependent hydrolase (beta-lactamase superfamily II)